MERLDVARLDLTRRRRSAKNFRTGFVGRPDVVEPPTGAVIAIHVHADGTTGLRRTRFAPETIGREGVLVAVGIGHRNNPDIARLQQRVHARIARGRQIGDEPERRFRGAPLAGVIGRHENHIRPRRTVALWANLHGEHRPLLVTQAQRVHADARVDACERINKRPHAARGIVIVAIGSRPHRAGRHHIETAHLGALPAKPGKSGALPRINHDQRAPAIHPDHIEPARLQRFGSHVRHAHRHVLRAERCRQQRRASTQCDQCETHRATCGPSTARGLPPFQHLRQHTIGRGEERLHRGGPSRPAVGARGFTGGRTHIGGGGPQLLQGGERGRRRVLQTRERRAPIGLRLGFPRQRQLRECAVERGAQSRGIKGTDAPFCSAHARGRHPRRQ